MANTIRYPGFHCLKVRRISKLVLSTLLLLRIDPNRQKQSVLARTYGFPRNVVRKRRYRKENLV